MRTKCRTRRTTCTRRWVAVDAAANGMLAFARRSLRTRQVQDAATAPRARCEEVVVARNRAALREWLAEARHVGPGRLFGEAASEPLPVAAWAGSALPRRLTQSARSRIVARGSEVVIAKQQGRERMNRAIRTHLALLSVVMVVMTVSACVAHPTRERQRMAANASKCTGAGYQPGTEGFSNCMLQMSRSKQP